MIKKTIRAFAICNKSSLTSESMEESTTATMTKKTTAKANAAATSVRP